MKNKENWAGILVMALAFGMTALDVQAVQRASQKAVVRILLFYFVKAWTSLRLFMKPPFFLTGAVLKRR
ncbi:MAG: hypothetical protein LBG43_06760 [Treponema sp.]|jgi:hypothetical protein|nr:hypothetical protein [Treponema sp.]